MVSNCKTLYCSLCFRKGITLVVVYIDPGTQGLKCQKEKDQKKRIRKGKALVSNTLKAGAMQGKGLG